MNGILWDRFEEASININILIRKTKIIISKTQTTTYTQKSKKQGELLVYLWHPHQNSVYGQENNDKSKSDLQLS